MDAKTIDTLLREITPSEKYHIANPGKRSDRYSLIPKIKIKDDEVYEFSFDSILKNENISIIKESRFTDIPLHRHKVIEINYVYSGECTQIINGRTTVLHTGDVCLLDRNTPHSIQSIHENDIILTIDMPKRFFTDGFLQRLSSQGIVSQFLVGALQDNASEKHFILFRTDNSADFRTAIISMLSEYYDEEKNNEIIYAYMTIILGQLLRIYKRNHLSNYHDEKTVPIIEIIQYIEDNYMNITLQEAADHFGFNANYFSNYLKKFTGKSFKELIIIKKLSMACYYLTNTEQPIYQISHEIGYENLGFFYKKFQQTYGVLPQEYREKQKTI